MLKRYLVWLWLFCCHFAYANPLLTEQVPEPLKPWIGWVLDEHKDHACPYLYNQEQRQCAWPGALSLQVNAQGGTFTQQWQVYGETTLRLPGDKHYWPQQVQDQDKKPVIVLEHEGYPSVQLVAGSYTLSGQFTWDVLPESLFVAPDSGIVQVTVNDKWLANPEFDNAGRVWLNRSNDTVSEDQLDLQVFRKVFDSHPLQVTTSIQLRVSGKQRNVELGSVLLDGFIPLALNSPLPTRLGQDGKLQIQVRPGEWTLTLTGRAPNQLKQLRLPAPIASWPSEEVWVLAADPQVRQIQVEGVNSIDPSQTRLPAEWMNLPAYLLTSDSTMVLQEQHRGLTDSPVQLSLNRQMWLDFDGKGYTLADQLSGTVAQQTRLAVNPDIQLGRVTVEGKPQLITHQDASQADGVEIRRQTVNVQAESRYQAAINHPPVSGWQQELQRVNTVLHLPPGWLLFAATGTDNLPHTWLQQWSLLDLFLVLLLSVAVGYLYSWQWGVMAAIAMLLTWQQAYAPHYSWLNVVAITALWQVVVQPKLKRLLGYYRLASVLLLIISVFSYSLNTVRIALYPQLQGGSGSHFNSDFLARPQATAPTAGAVAPSAPAPAPMPATAAVEMAANEEADMNKDAAKAKSDYVRQEAEKVVQELTSTVATKNYAAKSARASSLNQKQLANLQELDPNSMIQTGPGLPEWQWQQVYLEWSGVIKADERVGLWLISPAVHAVLLLLGVSGLWLLGARLLVQSGTFRTGLKAYQQWLKPAQIAVYFIAFLPLLNLMPKTSFAADINTNPTPELLQTLEERLVRAPDCLPDCAQIEQMHLLLNEQGLAIHLRVHTAATVAIPLPSQQSTWLAQTVLVDQAPTQALRRDNAQQLWVVLPAGTHDVVLNGVLPTRNNLTLALPLKPHRVTWQGDGWKVDGIRENGIPEDQLQISRTTNLDEVGMQDMPTLPAFVIIERRLELGLDWYVTTTVKRLSESANPISLTIPLLAGEQPLSEQFTLKDNALQINLKPQQAELQWTSRLATSENIQLTANENSAWLEEWQIVANSMWHVDTTGIPANTYLEEDGQGSYSWKPWPNERLTLAITRPQGVQGQTITILGSQTQVEVGKRARNVSLSLNLHSSRGAQYTLQLPEQVVVKELSIDGIKQAIQQQQGKITLPLLPRKQQVILKWQEEGVFPLYYSLPKIDLGLPSVNHETVLNLPQDRWVLWVKGPLLGPAVLFWGMLLVLLAVALILGRTKLTPLNVGQWFLLGIGLSQTSPYLMVLVVIWLIALNYRQHYEHNRPYWQFNLLQLSLLGLTLLALMILIGAVANGLLGSPDMQIAGNASSAYYLHWYQDRTAMVLPQPAVVSVSIWYYRLLMLAWSLWLAVALLRWLRWGWQAFSAGSLWQSKPPKVSAPVSDLVTP